MENKGVPAAVVCTEMFGPTAYTVAAAQGVPWYPYSIIPHPIAVLSDDAIEDIANRSVLRVVQLLTASSVMESNANR